MLYQAARHGFSLIELMIVVGIIAILAMVATPRFRMYQCKARRAAVLRCTDALRKDYINAFLTGSGTSSVMGVAGSQSCQDKLSELCLRFDVNGDWVVDNLDRIILMNVLNSFSPLTPTPDVSTMLRGNWIYDLNGDGIISNQDVFLVMGCLGNPNCPKTISN